MGLLDLRLHGEARGLARAPGPAVPRPVAAVIRRWLPWFIVAVAAALLVVPIDPGLVERVYSTRAYLLWQSRLTFVSNGVPFALFDLLLGLAAVTAAWITASAVRGGCSTTGRRAWTTTGGSSR